jgi:1,4-dihydroxy-2-naphthoate octaprenyltransferase
MSNQNKKTFIVIAVVAAFYIGLGVLSKVLITLDKPILIAIGALSCVYWLYTMKVKRKINT